MTALATKQEELVICPTCQGRGLLDRVKECLRCFGSGKIHQADLAPGEDAQTEADAQFPNPEAAPLPEPAVPQVVNQEVGPGEEVAPEPTVESNQENEADGTTSPDNAAGESTESEPAGPESAPAAASQDEQPDDAGSSQNSDPSGSDAGATPGSEGAHADTAGSGSDSEPASGSAPSA